MKASPMSQILTGVLAISLIACTKHAANSGSNKSGGTTGALSLSQATVKKGQPLIASLPSGVSANDIHWSVTSTSSAQVTPTSFAHLTPANGQAMVLFAQAGAYKVTASYTDSSGNPNDSSSAPVTVIDSPYTPAPPVNYDTSSLAGDQITLTPMLDSVMLTFYAQTTKSYSCFSNLVNLLYWGSGIEINFYEVISADSSSCNGVQNPASAMIFPGSIQGWTPGVTYPLTINVGTTTYTGSFTVTANSVSFTWPYTSGVIISPTQVSTTLIKN
jgi:hypothetical protein